MNGFGWSHPGDDTGGYGWDRGGTIADEIESGRKPDTSIPDCGWDKAGDDTGGYGY